jgi:hypothetical protein
VSAANRLEMMVGLLGEGVTACQQCVGLSQILICLKFHHHFVCSHNPIFCLTKITNGFFAAAELEMVHRSCVWVPVVLMVFPK